MGMNVLGSWRRWRGVPLGGRLQRALRFCFSARDGEAKTSEIAEYSRQGGGGGNDLRKIKMQSLLAPLLSLSHEKNSHPPNQFPYVALST